MKYAMLLFILIGCSNPTEPESQIKCIKKVIPMPEGYTAVSYTSPYKGVACKRD